MIAPTLPSNINTPLKRMNLHRYGETVRHDKSQIIIYQ